MPRRNDIAKILIIGSVMVAFRLLVSSPPPSIACAILPPTVDVTPDFDVLVVDNGRPVPGIPIQISRLGVKSDHPLLLLKSGADGRVAVKALAAGEYSIESNFAMWVPGFIARVGNANAQHKKSLVEFHWPNYHIVRSQQIRGRLWSANPNKPFQELDLRLFHVDGVPASRSQFTGPSGRFEFPGVEPGLYILWLHAKQLNVPFEAEGPIAVELAPSDRSAADGLDLSIGSTSCGIYYAQCDQRHPINLSSREIRIVDPNGAVVASAQYSVTDASGNKIASGLSDQEGVVLLPEKLTGTHKLMIYRAGFTPLEQALDFLPYESGAGDLKAVLNPGGSCSQAKLEKHATPQ